MRTMTLRGGCMRRHLGRWSILVLTAAASAVGHAAPSRDQLVVSTAWLAQHASDPDLVLLHIGDKAAYDAEHIVGARYVGTRDVSATPTGPDGLTLEMPVADTLRSQ